MRELENDCTSLRVFMFTTRVAEAAGSGLWSRTTLSCACLLCLCSRFSQLCASACRVDTKTLCPACLRKSSPLDDLSQVSTVRCTWTSLSSRRISSPASALTSRFQLFAACLHDGQMRPSPRRVHGVRSHVPRRRCAEAWQHRGGGDQDQAHRSVCGPVSGAMQHCPGSALWAGARETVGSRKSCTS